MLFLAQSLKCIVVLHLTEEYFYWKPAKKLKELFSNWIRKLFAVTAMASFRKKRVTAFEKFYCFCRIITSLKLRKIGWLLFRLKGMFKANAIFRFIYRRHDSTYVPFATKMQLFRDVVYAVYKFLFYINVWHERGCTVRRKKDIFNTLRNFHLTGSEYRRKISCQRCMLSVVFFFYW